MDVAVDPVEGTNLLAYGRPNAIAVVWLAPAGAMFDPGPSYYMQKLVVPAPARGVVDIRNHRRSGQAEYAGDRHAQLVEDAV